jgi:hypothetical protein
VAKIEFKAKVWASLEGKGWTFVTLPKTASAKLPARGRVAIAGTIDGFAFRSSAFPDGEGSHIIQVNNDMKKGAGIAAGDTAAFVIEPSTDEVKVEVPADLKKALAKSAKAAAQFADITPKARAEWVTWVTSAKREETRAGRVAKTVQRLAKGDRRPSD